MRFLTSLLLALVLLGIFFDPYNLTDNILWAQQQQREIVTLQDIKNNPYPCTSNGGIHCTQTQYEQLRDRWLNGEAEGEPERTLAGWIALFVSSPDNPAPLSLVIGVTAGPDSENTPPSSQSPQQPPSNPTFEQQCRQERARIRAQIRRLRREARNDLRRAFNLVCDPMHITGPNFSRAVALIREARALTQRVQRLTGDLRALDC